MLELQSVTWSNFLSYGDYENKIDFTKLDQALIVGEVLDDNDNRGGYGDSNPVQKRRSNGAGKSTIPSVIQWILFGRTMHSASPGDKVVNYFTGGDCRGTVEFKNGDSITRVRKTNGDTELMYIKDGEQNSALANTLSVAKIQQQKLNKEFGLDWEIFCGSVFFNQYGKPWMEMADQVRKKAMERILHVDKFTYYAAAAKSKVDATERTVAGKRNRIEHAKGELQRLDYDITTAQAASQQFDSNQRERQRKLLEAAVSEKNARDAIVLPDLDALSAKWDIVKAIEKKISEFRLQANSITTQISDKQGTILSIKRGVDLWQTKSGKICTSCEQAIDAGHIATKIEPMQADIKRLEKEVADLIAERNSVNAKVTSTEALLSSKKPDLSLAAASEKHKEWQRHDDAIKRHAQSVKTIAAETNPNIEIIDRARRRQTDLQAEIVDLEKDAEIYNFQANHYSYIHKAYNDRTKIKSVVFQEHIPMINKKLKHYLDVFNLDVRIELTPSLGINSNMWGYEFESGGERKRTDVAFMLAMFDFHQVMYGRQCNLLVLDEVDGRLDDDGIDALINIIKNDLAPKVESVLIISHRNLMFDTFPHEIRVTRENRLSRLTVT